MEPAPPTLDLSPAGTVPDLLRGLALPFRAARLMLSTPRLFWLSLASGALTFVALAGLAWGLWRYNGPLLGLIWERPAEWYWQLLYWPFRAATTLLLFAVGASTLPGLLSAPLADPLSVAAEEALGARPAGTGGLWRLGREVAASLWNALGRIAVLYAGLAILALLWLLPGAGPALWSALGFFWSALWLGASFLDIPMSRHLHRFAELRAAVLGRLALCFGFGTATYLLLWIPVLNAFFVPVAVVGGTLLYRGLLPGDPARVDRAPTPR